MAAPASSNTDTNSLLLNRAPGDTRVVVAMSGGVDSSVVAALLKAEGYDVIGITLQLYDHGSAVGKKGACCAGQDIHDARRVAQTLGIPHYVLDYEKRFEEAVINAFADSYIMGETPIPCVTCNQKIKFNELLDTARELGADVLATGHYIQVRRGENGLELCRAVDADRDQSYFLFATTPDQLEMLRFPLGALPKANVRKLAQQYGLDIAQKPDSQDICFVPTGKYAQIIEKLKPGAGEAGDIVHLDGTVLGRHGGIINYTVGQRRGLGIAARDPLYVVRLDATLNQVIVGPRSSLYAHWVTLRDVNWLGDDPINTVPMSGLAIHARIRSTQPPQPATLYVEGANVRVLLRDGEHGIAAGQACVFYSDGSETARILGGGWITKALSRAEESETLHDRAVTFKNIENNHDVNEI